MALTIKYQRKWPGLVAAAAVLVALLVPSSSAEAVSVSNAPENNANAIMWGGCFTKTACLDKMSKGDGHHSAANLKEIYFGTSGGGMSEANFKKTVDGIVTKDGQVLVNGKPVATGAWSAGRNYMPGSQKFGSVWFRPTSVSFQSDALPAFVYMENGVFRYALIKNCGNMVRANAVKKPTPTPTPVKPTPTPVKPKPVPMTYACEKLIPSQIRPGVYQFTLKERVQNVQVTGYRFIVNGQYLPEVPVNYIQREIAAGETVRVAGQVHTTAGYTQIHEGCTATISVPGQVLGATLPQTGGAEMALGGVAGLAAIGVASRAYMRSRKSLLETLRGKIRSNK